MKAMTKEQLAELLNSSECRSGMNLEQEQAAKDNNLLVMSGTKEEILKMQASNNRTMMNTIEERAKAFCEKNICSNCGTGKDCDRQCLGVCTPTYNTLEWLSEFGKSEHEELTRWRDPKLELPEQYQEVLIKYKYADSAPRYAVGCHDGSAWEAGASVTKRETVVGWRPIHE